MSEVYLKTQAYGKVRVRLMKVIRNDEWHDIVELTVNALLEGDFEEAYTKADNTLVVATDSIKNTIYVLAKHSKNVQLIELFAVEIGNHFITKYEHVTKANISITKHRWSRMLIDGKLHNHSFLRDGEETNNTTVIVEKGKKPKVQSGLKDLLILKTTGSAFHSFLRDEFTTLPETDDRILSTSVDATWTFKIPNPDAVAQISFNTIFDSIRQITLNTFANDNSVSVQATLYRLAELVLKTHPQLESVSYALPNKHCFAFDMQPFGFKNTGKDADVFVPFNDPSGLITATIARSE